MASVPGHPVTGDSGAGVFVLCTVFSRSLLRQLAVEVPPRDEGEDRPGCPAAAVRSVVLGVRPPVSPSGPGCVSAEGPPHPPPRPPGRKRGSGPVGRGAHGARGSCGARGMIHSGEHGKQCLSLTSRN